MEIVSGRTGKPHVTSQQFRQLIEGTVGQESCILTSGENLEPELASNNSLKIRSGMLAHHGNISSVKIGTYDVVNLDNGSQGMKRIDLVVCRYTRNAETEVENCNWVVIAGTPVSSNPVAPTYTVGNLQEGDLVDDCPVFEVHYDGINVTEVKKILPVAPNLTELNSKTIKAFGASESDYISFTAPFDCYAIIGFSCLGWGYDGGFLEFQIKSSESLPEIFAHTGGCSGNNNVYIPLLAKSCFSGLKKGKTYSFSRKNLYGSFGASWNIKWSAICIPA
mgnify:CR=1 FL=1